MPRKPSELVNPLQFADRQLRRLERDRAEADKAVGMAADDLGDVVVDRARRGKAELGFGPVEHLHRRRRERLHVDAHDVHVREALLDRGELRVRAPHLLGCTARVRSLANFIVASRSGFQCGLHHSSALSRWTWQWMSTVNHLPRA